MKTLKERNVLYFSGSCIYWVGFVFKLEDKSPKKKGKSGNILLRNFSLLSKISYNCFPSKMPALLVLPRELFRVTSNHIVEVLQIQRPTEGQDKKVA